MKVPIKYEGVVQQLLKKGSMEVKTQDLDKVMGTSLYFKRLAKRNGYDDITSMFADLKKKKKSKSRKYMIYY